MSHPASSRSGIASCVGVENSSVPVVPSIRRLAHELGVSHTRLNVLNRQGRITAELDGNFDVEKCRAQFLQSTGVEYRSRARIPEANVGPASVDSETSSFQEFNKARAEHERLKVREKELDIAEREKTLLPADEVREKIASMIGAARSKLLLLPDRVAQRVAPLSDVLECRAVLEKEIRLALMDLSNYVPPIQVQ